LQPTKADNRFVNLGILLFLDSIIIALSGWTYWLMISRFVSLSEVGQATAIYSLVLFFFMLSQMGFEYPLLKKSFVVRSRTLWTTLSIELIITFAIIPALIFIQSDVYGTSLQRFNVISITLLVFSSIGFVTRFSLLGKSEVKSIIIIDIIGTGIRFLSGYVLVTNGLGALGILYSFLFQQIVTTTATLAIATRIFAFGLSSMSYAKEIIKEGLINMPSKFSRTFIISFSIVLLASFGVSDSAIAKFYVALMISIMGAGMASNIAFMVIPNSSMVNKDMSSDSMRIGLSLIAPLIVTLLIAPKQILSLIAGDYASAEIVLLVLSFSILPSAIIMNTISNFNNLNKSKELLLIGAIQIVTFIIAFFSLVPQYQTLGAAISIFLSFSSTSVTCVLLSECRVLNYILTSIIAVAGGWIAGYILSRIFEVHVVFAILVSVLVTLSITLSLKNISVNEIREIVKVAYTGKDSGSRGVNLGPE